MAKKSSRSSSSSKSALPDKRKRSIGVTAKVKSKQQLNKQKQLKQKQKQRRKSKPLFLMDENQEKVWITTATLQDMKEKQKQKKNVKNKRLELVLIPSPATRQAIYNRAAEALEVLERRLLPPYGQRPWNVVVRIQDSSTSTTTSTTKSSPYFVWKQSSSTSTSNNSTTSCLQLAVWPHWLDKIPAPPRFPGYSSSSSSRKTKNNKTTNSSGSAQNKVEAAQQEQNQDDDNVQSEDEEEEHDEEGEEEEDQDDSFPRHDPLLEEEPCSLSRLAWEERWRVPVPNLTIKWISPLLQTFTTRKSAYEHAVQLCKQEVLMDKILHGYGANGQELQPNRPSKRMALTAGKYRFEREGLWVVGQEESWQLQRLLQQQQQQAKNQKQQKQQQQLKQRGMSPLAYYVSCNRKNHQKRRQEQLDAERQDHDSCANENGNTHTPQDDNDDGSSPPASCRRRLCFTLRDAEKELREIWKHQLSEHEQNEWALQCSKKNTMTKEDDDNDDNNVQQGLSRNDYKKDNKSTAATSDNGHEDSHPCATSPSPTMATATTTTTATTTPPPQEQETNHRGDVDTSSCPVAMGTVAAIVSPQSSSSSTSTSTSTSTLSPAAATRVGVTTTTTTTVTPDSTVSSSKKKNEAKKDDILCYYDKDIFPESTHWRLNPQQIKLCYEAGMEHFDQIMRTVKARDLLRELQDGFDLLRERGRGRYDMELPAFDTPQFQFLTDIKKAPWMPIVKEILGKDVVLIHKGMFLSVPGAEKQGYHQDGIHLTDKYQRAVHAINVFVPLVDMTLEHGPTEFCLGSHILGNEDYDEKFLECPLVSAGTPVIFDYRLGHRGLANTASTCRPIVYCTYARAADGKEFRDTVNFSRKRYHKIGDLVEKAPSREERAKKRELTSAASLQTKEKETTASPSASLPNQHQQKRKQQQRKSPSLELNGPSCSTSSSAGKKKPRIVMEVEL